jgi:hypothetical protein
MPGKVLVFFWVAVLSVPGCAYLGGAGRTSPAPDVEDIETVLVAPFEVVSDLQSSSANRCPVCNAVVNPGRVQSGAADYMTRQLMGHLKARSDYILMGPGMAAGIRAQIISKDVGVSRRRLLVEMGKEIGADAVVSGTLYRFRRRVGTDLAIESPASVGFGVHFIRCSDGALIWSKHFDETQQDLSENLLKLPSFVKRGGHWLTAERLAAYGLSDVMDEFPVPGIVQEGN